MTPLHIKIVSGKAGFKQLVSSWRHNYRFYIQEAVGLAIFMISACFFGALLESHHGFLHDAIPVAGLRQLLMGAIMSATALFIFYGPLTASSGAHINPAVSLCFFRLGKLCHWDALFYIIFQFAGGTMAVLFMQYIMGDVLTAPPVNSVITIPGSYGTWAAFVVELVIAFITMMIVLRCSHHQHFKKYTRLFAALLVFVWVVLAGPVSGFGMNPARSFASAFSSGRWDAFWIYIAAPLMGMFTATEIFLLSRRRTVPATVDSINQS